MCFLLGVLLLSAPNLASATEQRDESELWVPSFSAYFDIIRQEAEGRIDSTEIAGPPFPAGCFLDRNPPFPDIFNGDVCPNSDVPRNFGTTIAQNGDGSDTNVTTMVGGSFELMTPRLTERFLMPRVFAHIDLAATFGFERNLAGGGSPGAFAPPILPAFDQRIFEVAIRGQGSRARTQLDRLLWSGGAGLAFTIDAFDRRLRVKPSFEFIRQEVEVSGVVNRAVQLIEPTTTLNDFRFISLSAKRKVRYYGFGPGLELEADTARASSIVMSVFVSGRLYRFAGSLRETLFVSNEFGESATFTIEHERWAYRAGVGVRFRWVGE
ncbi:MAG: hypothetical protein AAF430_25275 [Myxococcota bacterium]